VRGSFSSPFNLPSRGPCALIRRLSKACASCFAVWSHERAIARKLLNALKKHQREREPKRSGAA
jgi:hypothetical protein